MAQFEDHEFLKLIYPKNQLYSFVLLLAAQYEDSWHHVGSCCLLAPNVALTAKHIVEHIYRHIVKKEIDIYDPEFQNSKHGFEFSLPDGVGIDAFQFQKDGTRCRRFSVKGIFNVGYKVNDAILLRLEPHPLCPYKDEDTETDLPIFDLVPPSVGLDINGFGYPDHPANPNSQLGENHCADYYLYQGDGVVESINWELGSAQFASFRTSMKTVSGMSGGPVFVSREIGNVCCGIVSRGGFTDYSFVTPLWSIVGGQISPVDGMPIRHGASCILDLMKAGQILAIGAERFELLEHPSNQEFQIICEDHRLLRNGYDSMIRPMESGDIDACMKIEEIRFEEAQRWDFNSFALNLNKIGIAFVKVIDQKVVGFVIAEGEDDGLHIKNLAVESDGRGWGTQLLNHVLPISGSIYLTVEKNNKAVDFYKQKGFSITSDTPGYFYMSRLMNQ